MSLKLLAIILNYYANTEVVFDDLVILLGSSLILKLKTRELFALSHVNIYEVCRYAHTVHMIFCILYCIYMCIYIHTDITEL